MIGSVSTENNIAHGILGQTNATHQSKEIISHVYTKMNSETNNQLTSQTSSALGGVGPEASVYSHKQGSSGVLRSSLLYGGTQQSKTD